MSSLGQLRIFFQSLSNTVLTCSKFAATAVVHSRKGEAFDSLCTRKNSTEVYLDSEKLTFASR